MEQEKGRFMAFTSRPARKIPLVLSFCVVPRNHKKKNRSALRGAVLKRRVHCWHNVMEINVLVTLNAMRSA